MMRLVIKQARIIDGSGAPWFRGDVLVTDGKIAAIGSSVMVADAAQIDAGDSYLAPGFIDAHAHDDLAYLRYPDRHEKVAQGVTTVVVGNCSFGLYPQNPKSADPLRAHFGSLLGLVRPEESFADYNAYRHTLQTQGIAINLVSLVGHAALRLAVMGMQRRPATAEERTAMANLLAEQLKQGAAGLSLGLVYPPSSWADRAELISLAEIVASHGALLAAHVRSYEGGLLDSVDEFLDLLKASRTAGLLSHLQAAGRPYWGSVPKALHRLEAARDAGVDVSFDMYPYPAGSSTILQLLPPSALAGGIGALLDRLDDQVELIKLAHAINTGDAPDDPGWESKITLIGWENVRIGGVETTELRFTEGQSLAELAHSRLQPPFETLVWLLRVDRGQTNIVMFQQSPEDLRTTLAHPLHMLGSDGLPREGGKPHPRAFGSFPRYLAQALAGESGLRLEQAVQHMSSAPAQRFGLHSRGLIRPGMVADLVLFDGSVADGATFEQPTLPPRGITDVLVAGQFVLRRGQPTHIRPGKMLSRV